MIVVITSAHVLRCSPYLPGPPKCQKNRTLCCLYSRFFGHYFGLFGGPDRTKASNLRPDPAGGPLPRGHPPECPSLRLWDSEASLDGLAISLCIYKYVYLGLLSSAGVWDSLLGWALEIPRA